MTKPYDNMWPTINSVGPKLKWKKYYHNAWGAWFEGTQLWYKPSEGKFSYRDKTYYGVKGYHVLMENYSISSYEEFNPSFADLVNDPVNSPNHYNRKGIECVVAVEASMSEEEFRGYLKGNIEKYLWRYSYKGKPLEDLKKARWYLDKLIEKALDNEG